MKALVMIKVKRGFAVSRVDAPNVIGNFTLQDVEFFNRLGAHDYLDDTLTGFLHLWSVEETDISTLTGRPVSSPDPKE